MTEVYQYRVYCIEEASFVYTWSTETPTICPNNHVDRSIDLNNVVIIGKVGENRVIAGQDSLKNFQHTCIPINVPAMTPGDVYVQTFSWPMLIQIWKTEFYTNTEHVNDRLTIYVAPDTVVGVLTQAASINDTTIHVSSTVINNNVFSNGVDIELDNGVISEEPGRVIGHSTSLNTVTFETPLTQNFAIGTYVKLNLKVINDVVMHRTESVYKIAEKGLKGRTIPANTNLRALYTNTNGQEKKLYLVIEIYYE